MGTPGGHCRTAGFQSWNMPVGLSFHSQVWRTHSGSVGCWWKSIPNSCGGVRLRPRVDGHDVLVGDQPGDVTVGVELVDEGLGLAEIDLVVHQALVDVVQSHAAERRGR